MSALIVDRQDATLCWHFCIAHHAVQVRLSAPRVATLRDFESRRLCTVNARATLLRMVAARTTSVTSVVLNGAER
jgi:hypothetical protein